LSGPSREGTPESDVYDGAPHPREAGTLIGHAAAEAELLEAYRSGRPAHAWLIGGPAGIGKATLAWRFARFVLANPDISSPSVGAARDLFVARDAPAARLIDAQAHPDLVWLRRMWNPERKNFRTDIRVEEVRHALGLFHKSAGAGGWRICIVDTGDDLNSSSASALLKMIEEPPTRSLFLILAHRPGLTLLTIRSRCRRLQLDPLQPAAIVQILRGLGAPWSLVGERELTAAVKSANGSVSEALKRIDPERAEIEAMIAAAIAGLPESDGRAVHRLAEAVAAKGSDDAFEGLTLALYDWLAERAAARAGEGAERLAPLAELWDKARAAARDTETYNLDKRLHVLSLFAELSAAARRL
jgi:DNA polymerase III subunit delta'